jgi:hypothetical protein
MKGGIVRTKTVKEMLNPETTKDPAIFVNEQNNPLFIGAVIIKTYNNIKAEYSSKIILPDIRSEPKQLTPQQLDNINSFITWYRLMYNRLISENQSHENLQFGTFLSKSKNLEYDEFEKQLKYILEGGVYKKKMPFYTDNEFDRFKSFAKMLIKCENLIRKLNKESYEQTKLSSNATPSVPHTETLPDYNQYGVTSNDQTLKTLQEFCKELKQPGESVLCEMACVISLKRIPPNWTWSLLDESERSSIQSNPYCAIRRMKRLIIVNGQNKPLDKFNVSNLEYQIQRVGEYLRRDTLNKILNVMSEKLISKKNDILGILPTDQYKYVHIVDNGSNYYKYYEFKICRSEVRYTKERNLPVKIPVIICTLSAFDEDGMCDFEFVYVLAIKKSSASQQDSSPVEPDIDILKRQIYYRTIDAENYRMTVLLGGQTFNTTNDTDQTEKQYYYDMIALDFDVSRTISGDSESESLDDKKQPILLDSDDSSGDPCTLILKYETNPETEKEEPVWKVAKATPIQIAACKRVTAYLMEPNQPLLDDTNIRVFKISNNEQDKTKNITVFVQVKKQDDKGNILYVEYQALGGECYAVYNNYTTARQAAEINKSNFNWASS